MWTVRPLSETHIRFRCDLKKVDLYGREEKMFTWEFGSGSSMYGIFSSRLFAPLCSGKGAGSRDFQNADRLLKTSAITSKVEEANVIPTKAPVTTS